MKMIKTGKLKYGIFIIESMRIEDEEKDNLDGWRLKSILDLCKIESQYYQIRTKKELQEIIKIFDKSKYAFLHISCHGSPSALELTYDVINFVELERIIGAELHKRRLFLSACEAARFELAEHFIPKHHCFSVIGTPDIINTDLSAIFWSAFYYKMYQVNEEAMPQTNLTPILEEISAFFKMKINYFSIITDENPNSIDHLKEFNYDSGITTLDKIRKTNFTNLHR